MSRLVIVDQNHVIVADFGEFSPQEAEVFFADALSAMQFQRGFPQVTIRNEIQLRLLTDTLAKMGLLHGNPEAVQDWMRPYITNELQRQAQRQNIFQRANDRLTAYRERAWEWVKAELFGGITRLLSKIINSFTGKK